MGFYCNFIIAFTAILFVYFHFLCSHAAHKEIEGKTRGNHCPNLCAQRFLSMLAEQAGRCLKPLRRAEEKQKGTGVAQKREGGAQWLGMRVDGISL